MKVMDRGARLSPDGQHRYSLTRLWSSRKPKLVWVMLNPSTADAEVDDPTIRRCISFSDKWGFGGIVVLNLFTYRTKSPTELKAAGYPVGPRQVPIPDLLAYLGPGVQIVAAWGGHTVPEGRVAQVFQGVPPNKVWCLGTTKSGAPKHPLYVKGDTQLRRYEP